MNEESRKLLQEKLDFFLTEEAKNADPVRAFQLKKEIEEIRKQLSESRNVLLDSVPKVDLHCLPDPTTALIGRKTELAQLTESLENPNKHLAIIVAAGGIGKSALTDEWLRQIERQNYYGKTRVFAWSFYSQGSHNTFTNSQSFFHAVLPFLGISDIPKDDIEKARILSRECQKQPCLLILDGLEPLQYPENLHTMNGELQDMALKEFIACFRRAAGKSFVLLSSRQPLVELKKWQPETYLSMDLHTLPHEDGANLLANLGVMGNEKERQAISQNLNGHALSLSLIGHLLSEHHAGDPRYAKELPPLTSAHGDGDAEKDSRHALRVLNYYDSLQDDASRCFLQLLGLFDRPMHTAEKAILIEKANHAAPLRALSDSEWKKVEQRLEKNGILLSKKINSLRLEWDIHPLIRSYFGEQFKVQNVAAWKQAHSVLFDYYQTVPKTQLPDSLEELEPLYRAVMHGCLEGEFQKALIDVYQKRILRGNEFYSLKKLGAYSADLTAISAFFPQGWNSPVTQGLSEANQGWLLAVASFCLMSLGRLAESVEPRVARSKIAENLKDWENASNSAGNLVDLYLPMGRLVEAEKSAKQAIDFAERTENLFRQMGSRARLATTLHRQGKLTESLQVFEKAEEIQQKWQPDYPRLYLLAGARYCVLLLELATDRTGREAVLERGRTILEWHENGSATSLFDIAFCYLTIGRALLALNQLDQAGKEFDQAVAGIRKAGTIIFMPEFLLERAKYYQYQGNREKAEFDLEEAQEIIDRCGMKLYEVDALLLRATLKCDKNQDASEEYRLAEELIGDTGYHLRDKELELIRNRIMSN